MLISTITFSERINIFWHKSIEIMMNLNRPQTLEIGKFYLHRDHSMIRKYKVASVVIFSSYTACPAFVIVQDKSGVKIRCPRDDLFTLYESESIKSSLGLATLLEYFIFASVSFGTFFQFYGLRLLNKTLITSRSYSEQIFGGFNTPN